MQTLELGSLYICLLDIIKHKPNRDLMLFFVKILLPLMKTNNKQAKYPLELLRLLIQQYSLLPMREAYEVFNACFVNTKGRSESYVPADQQMEWVVRINKRHLKHMYSQRNEDCMQRRSKVIHGVNELSTVYDEETEVTKRSTKHKRDTAEEDEIILLRQLRKIRPFQFTADRAYTGFNKIQPSLMCQFDAHHFTEWFNQKKYTFTP